MKKLCILIVNYNSTSDTLELIENLKKSTYNKFDILVFDNNSKEDLSRLENVKGIKFVKSDINHGLTGGVNRALSFIKNKYVLLLNPDINIDVDSVNEMLTFIETDDKIAFVGGAIYNFNNRNKVDAFGGKMNFYTGLAKPLKNESNIRELKFGEYSDACILMFNREIFQKLKGYDETYFMYVETEDILLKAMKAGYKVFINPNAKVWHKVYGSFGGKKSKFSVYHLNRNRYLFMKKHVSFLRYLLFILINFLFVYPVQLLLFVKRGQFNLICSFFKGIYHGIIGKYGASFFK